MDGGYREILHRKNIRGKLMSIVVIATVTSLVVSYIYSKWFMKNLKKWTDNFFKEEFERIINIFKDKQ